MDDNEIMIFYCLVLVLSVTLLLYFYVNYYRNCTKQENFNLDMAKNCKREMNDTWTRYSPCITNYNLVYPSNTSNPKDPETFSKQRAYYTGYNDGIVSNHEYDPDTMTKHKRLSEVRKDRKKIIEPDFIRDNILNTDYVYQSSQLIDEANNYGFAPLSGYDHALKRIVESTKENYDDSLHDVPCTDKDYDFLKDQPNYHPWNLIPYTSCDPSVHSAGRSTTPNALLTTGSKYKPAEEYNKKNKNHTATYKTHIYDAENKSSYPYGFEYNEFLSPELLKKLSDI